MSVQHPNILYVGDSEAGHALAKTIAPLGWFIFVPEDTLAALAMYVTYAPDIAVIDAAARPVFAAEVYHHLRSVEARPLLVLVEEHQRKAWGRGDGAAHIRPRGSDSTLLIRHIRQIVQADALLAPRW